MKKRFLIFGVIMMAISLLITGCDATETVQKEQLLHCKANSEGVDVIFNVSFKGNRISNMNLVYEMDLSDIEDDRIEAAKSEDYCKIVKESLSQYESAFKNCSQDISNKKLSVTSDLDIDKMDASESVKFGTIDNAKKGLEEVGYTCTVEE